jgi:hypothetical protein
MRIKQPHTGWWRGREDVVFLKGDGLFTAQKRVIEFLRGSGVAVAGKFS